MAWLRTLLALSLVGRTFAQCLGEDLLATNFLFRVVGILGLDLARCLQIWPAAARNCKRATTVLSRKSAHGRCILLSHQTGGWALFRVFPHSTLKERPPLFTYTSSAIAAIEQQARVSQSPPSTSTSLESLATSPLTTSSSLPPSAG